MSLKVFWKHVAKQRRTTPPTRFKHTQHTHPTQTHKTPPDRQNTRNRAVEQTRNRAAEQTKRTQNRKTHARQCHPQPCNTQHAAQHSILASPPCTLQHPTSRVHAGWWMGQVADQDGRWGCDGWGGAGEQDDGGAGAVQQGDEPGTPGHTPIPLLHPPLPLSSPSYPIPTLPLSSFLLPLYSCHMISYPATLYPVLPLSSRSNPTSLLTIKPISLLYPPTLRPPTLRPSTLLSSSAVQTQMCGTNLAVGDQPLPYPRTLRLGTDVAVW